MSERASYIPWPGLPTTREDDVLPIPPDTLSKAEREALRQSTEALVLDRMLPTPLPASRDLLVAEPYHPSVIESDAQA